MMRYLKFLACALLVGSSLQGCVPLIVAGAGSGALLGNDRRTTGAYIEDESIENKVSGRVYTDYKNDVHLNVTSYNRHVLLTGEVPDEATKTAIGKIASAVPNVKGVSNELAAANTAGLTSRGSDTVITSDVKLRFLDKAAGRFQTDHVKVVTERGTVYLMGVVTHKEAEAATEIASTTGGVLKVVRVFEYMD
jgi:osmotically-inducible protein OsmY